MDANPGVTIEHQPTPWADYFTKIQTLFAAGTPPISIAICRRSRPSSPCTQKACMCSWTTTSSATAYDISDFRPDAIELYRWDGKTYALPRDYGNQNLYYNVDLFEEAGVEPPPADWEDTEFTFDVFLDMAQQLTKTEGDRTTQWGFLVNRGQRPWASWVYSNGGALVHMDDTAWRPNRPWPIRSDRRGAAVPPGSDVHARGCASAGSGIGAGRRRSLLHRPCGRHAHQPVGGQPVPRHRSLHVGRRHDSHRQGGPSRHGRRRHRLGHPARHCKHPQTRRGTSSSTSPAPRRSWTRSRSAPRRPRASPWSPRRRSSSPNLPPANAKAFAQAQEYVVRDPVHVNWPEITQRIYNPTMDLLWSGTEDAATVARRSRRSLTRSLRKADRRLCTVEYVNARTC